MAFMIIVIVYNVTYFFEAEQACAHVFKTEPTLIGTAAVLSRYDEELLRTIRQFWTVSFSLWKKVSQTLQSVLCITTNKYLVCVLVVLLHARISVVSPIPFLFGRHFFPGHPYRGSTTVLPDTVYCGSKRFIFCFDSNLLCFTSIYMTVLTTLLHSCSTSPMHMCANTQ